MNTTTPTRTLHERDQEAARQRRDDNVARTYHEPAHRCVGAIGTHCGTVLFTRSRLCLRCTGIEHEAAKKERNHVHN